MPVGKAGSYLAVFIVVDDKSDEREVGFSNVKVKRLLEDGVPRILENKVGLVLFDVGVGTDDLHLHKGVGYSVLLARVAAWQLHGRLDIDREALGNGSLVVVPAQLFRLENVARLAVFREESCKKNIVKKKKNLLLFPSSSP